MHEEQELLAQINQFLPKNIDWKAGARRYLNDLIRCGGESYRQWHYTKPFIAEPLLGSPLHNDVTQNGVDKYVLWNEFYPILNILRKVDLPPNSSVLDVACGPGWISHFLGKMGHRVVGVDISEEMLNVARERVKAEHFPPYPLKALNVDFFVHDLEEAPLSTPEIFDFVLIDSALHHFYNPIKTLRNIATHLAPHGIIAIIEGLAQPGGNINPIEMAIMEKYHTLERPYTRLQMQQILNFAGFSDALFFESINGLIESNHRLHDPIQGVSGSGSNIVITSKSKETLMRLSSRPDPSEKHIEWIDFHNEEYTENGTSFRWSSCESCMKITGYESIHLELKSIYPNLTQQQQKVEVHLNGKTKISLEFNPHHDTHLIELSDLENLSQLQFFSDAVVYPFLHNINADKRQLAFMVKIIAAQ